MPSFICLPAHLHHWNYAMNIAFICRFAVAIRVLVKGPCLGQESDCGWKQRSIRPVWGDHEGDSWGMAKLAKMTNIMTTNRWLLVLVQMECVSCQPSMFLIWKLRFFVCIKSTTPPSSRLTLLLSLTLLPNLWFQWKLCSFSGFKC